MNKSDNDKADGPGYSWDFHLARWAYTGVFGGGSTVYHRLNKLRGKVPPLAFAERQGRPTVIAGKLPIWVHASSMGEVRVAAILIARMAGLRPETSFLCTTATETGYALAGEILPAAVTIVRAPIDRPRALSAFCEHFAPGALILIETEWWPNQLRECFRRRIPVFVANGRVSADSGRRYLWVKRYLKPLLNRITRLYMRSDEDAERVVALGVDRDRVEIAGGLKNAATGAIIMRKAPLAGPPIFLAGCTRPGEEQIILEAYDLAIQKVPDLRLWLAPRHPERFAEVGAILKNSGRRWAAYSVLPQKKLNGLDSPGIILIDTMGVLAGLYAYAAVSFVGGSLLPFGGHNPVEPVLSGSPVLFGPHTEGQDEAARGLVGSGLGWRVTNAAEMAHEVVRLIENPPGPDDFNQNRASFLASAARAAEHVAADIFQRLDNIRMKNISQQDQQ